MDRFVQTELLVLILHAHDGDAIDDPQHSERENERPDRRKQSGSELFQKEGRIAGEQSVRAAVCCRIPRCRGEHAEQHDAEKTADAVHAPHIKRIIPAQLVLQRAGVVADDTGDQADDAGGCRRNVTRRWCDRRQSRDRAG